MEFTQVGKYQIQAEIGQGAMGQVFKAHDPILGRDVALKTISAKVGADEEMRKRFHREAQAAARLNHPNIITVHDFGEEEGRIYIAMELLDGVDLKDFIASGALKSLGAKLEVMDQILEALAFAHTKGVVHRDLKPANIHVLKTGQLKLMDFGLARIGSAADTTKAGTVLGTPNYMSPEQVMGERADFRSDVFSIGAVFYEILTGRKPFDADSVHSVLFQVVHKEPEPVRKAAPETPPVLVDLVEKCLSKDPTRRFADAGELKGALGRVRASLSGARGPRPVADPATTATPSEPRAVTLRGATSPAAAGADPEATIGHAEVVDGAVALAAEPKPAPPPRSTPPTLSAKAATRIDPGRSRRAETARPATAADHGFWRRLAPLGLVFGVVSGIGGAVLWMQNFAAPGTPAPTSAGPDVGALTQTLAATQVELAERDLEDKNYRGAIAQAERALKIEPGSAPARAALEKARTALSELDAAVAEARSALEAGATDRASEALSRILALDPQHPAATDLTARLDSVFQAKAEEARRAATEAKSSAERAKADALEPFGRAARRAGDAEALFARREFASATQGFLEARDAFDRARRTAAARTATPPPKAPEPRPESAPRGAAPPTAPVTASPAPGLESRPAPGAPPARPRPLVAGRTVVRSSKAVGSGPAGFESEDVSVQKTPDFVGRIDFEVSPSSVRAGDPYTIQIHLVNDGRKAIQVRSVALTTTVDGAATSREVSPPAKELEPRQRTTVADVGGIWEEPARAWTLEVVVTSRSGDTCRNRLDWK